MPSGDWTHASGRARALRIAGTASLLVVATLGRARADDKQACAAAADQAQQLRDERHFAKERAQLLVCVRDVCPGVVKKDCSAWLVELDANEPSVVFSARDAKGQDASAVQVSCDHVPITSVIDGRAVRIDPGSHALRFEMGGSVIEQNVIIREGEKNRSIAVDFGAAAKAVSAPAPAPLAPSPDHAAPSVAEPAPGSPYPIGPVVLAGVGVAAIVVFAVLGSTGTSALSNLHATCGVDASCNQSDVDSTRKKLIVGDVALAVGVVSIAIATPWFFLSRGKPPAAVRAAQSHIDLGLGAGRFVPTIGGSF